MPDKPKILALIDLFHAYPELVDALEGGDYWRGADGSIAFDIEMPPGPDAETALRAFAALFESDVDVLPAGVPRPFRLLGPPMTLEDLREGR